MVEVAKVAESEQEVDVSTASAVVAGVTKVNEPAVLIQLAPFGYE